MSSRTIRILLGGVMVAGFATRVSADVRQNPYREITARNVFNLRPVSEQKIPDPMPMHLPSPLEVRLTGITTLPGEPRVLLETTDPQTGKTERPPPLRNGEHFKAITIVAIDPVNSRVQIKIGTVARTLDFESHGIKLAPSNSTTPAPPPLGRVIL